MTTDPNDHALATAAAQPKVPRILVQDIDAEDMRAEGDAAWFPWITTYVAGVEFRKDITAEFLATVPANARCVLRRDPTNPHDSNAIRVLLVHARTLRWIGFIPRVQAAWLHRLMDGGYPFRGRIEHVDLEPTRMAPPGAPQITVTLMAQRPLRVTGARATAAP